MGDIPLNDGQLQYRQENSSIIWTQSQRLDSPLIASTITSFYLPSAWTKYWGSFTYPRIRIAKVYCKSRCSGCYNPSFLSHCGEEKLKGSVKSSREQMELYVKRAFMRVIEWPNSRPEFAGSFVAQFSSMLFNSPTANLTISFFPSSFDLSLSLLLVKTQSTNIPCTSHDQYLSIAGTPLH